MLNQYLGPLEGPHPLINYGKKILRMRPHVVAPRSPIARPKPRSLFGDRAAQSLRSSGIFRSLVSMGITRLQKAGPRARARALPGIRAQLGPGPTIAP